MELVAQRLDNVFNVGKNNTDNIHELNNLISELYSSNNINKDNIDSFSKQLLSLLDTKLIEKKKDKINLLFMLLLTNENLTIDNTPLILHLINNNLLQKLNTRQLLLDLHKNNKHLNIIYENNNLLELILNNIVYKLLNKNLRSLRLKLKLFIANLFLDKNNINALIMLVYNLILENKINLMNDNTVNDKLFEYIGDILIKINNNNDSIFHYLYILYENEKTRINDIDQKKRLLEIINLINYSLLLFITYLYEELKKNGVINYRQIEDENKFIDLIQMLFFKNMLNFKNKNGITIKYLFYEHSNLFINMDIKQYDYFNIYQLYILNDMNLNKQKYKSLKFKITKTNIYNILTGNNNNLRASINTTLFKRNQRSYNNSNLNSLRSGKLKIETKKNIIKQVFFLIKNKKNQFEVSIILNLSNLKKIINNKDNLYVPCLNTSLGLMHNTKQVMSNFTLVACRQLAILQ